MAWDKGFNFRASSGYVTDGTDCTYVLGTETTATTRNGATFQFTTSTAAAQPRDRTTSGDSRLSGCVFVGSGTSTENWRLTLPATGAYDIYLAAGDQGNEQTIKLRVLDDTTAFITIADVGTGAVDQYVDATGAVRTRTQWIADSARGGTKVTRTFSSTILNVEIQPPVTASCPLAHLFVSQVTPAGWGRLLGMETNRLVTIYGR